MSEKRIWKFPLLLATEQDVMAPLGAQSLYVGLDPNGQLCVWMTVDSQAEKRAMTFYVVGTGHSVPNATVYSGSVVMGDYVWHVFRQMTFNDGSKMLPTVKP